jgi:hypothetical protein
VRENFHVFQQEFHDIPQGAHHRRCEGFLEKPNAGVENCNIGMIKEQRELKGVLDMQEGPEK